MIKKTQLKLNGEINNDPLWVCMVCGYDYKPNSTNQIYCSETCRKSAMNEKTKERYAELKIRVYELYGSECNHCGESDPMVLSLDHIKPVGKKRLLTPVLFPRILNDPDAEKHKYQLLCRNCNWRKMIQNNERDSSPPFAYRYELDRLESKINELSIKLNKKINPTVNLSTEYDVFEDIIAYISPLKNDIPLKPNGEIHSGKCMRWIKGLGFKIRHRDQSSLINEIEKILL